MGTYVVELVVAVNTKTGNYCSASTSPSSFSSSDADLIAGANAQTYNGSTGPYAALIMGETDFVGGGPSGHSASLDFDYSLIVPIIRLDGAGSLVSFAGLPAGFVPTSAELHASILSFNFGGAPTGVKWHLGTNVSALVTTLSAGDQLVYAYPVVPATMLDILNNGCGFEYVDVLTESTNINLYKLRIQGNYIIVNTAWVLPDPATSPGGTGAAGTGTPSVLNGGSVLNACGVATPSHVVISGTSPGAGYVALPMPPTPVIDSVTPPAGTKYGGQSVTIRGAAFSDAATVTFDGVAATSVVVVSQFEITCLTPAHAVGAVDVVVTNADGTHS